MLKVDLRFFTRAAGTLALLSVGLFLPALPAYALNASSMNLSFNVIIPVSAYVANALNQCDSHSWVTESWGGATALDWKQVHSRQCARAVFTTSTGGTEAYLRTNEFFSPENWSTVTQVKIDVWVENGKNSMGLRLEVHDNGTNSAQASTTNIAGGSWNTLTLPITVSGFQPSKIFLVLTNVANGDSACLSNLRITRGGVDEPWDTFETPSYAWLGSQDFTPWTGSRNEPISHKVTYGSSAGALCFPWTGTTAHAAKLEATNVFFQDFSTYTKFRARVYSDRTDVPVYMAFWDGTNWIPTSTQTVSTANTWVLMEWAKPTGTFNWAKPVTFMFMLNTSAGGSGQVYIDALEFVP